MYEIIMHAETEIKMVTNVESTDLAYIIARGREYGVNVRVTNSFNICEEVSEYVTLYTPVTCSGTEEDMAWFINEIKNLIVPFAAA